jgi:hypothetical protein
MRKLFWPCRGLFFVMKEEEVLQCSKDGSHEVFDRFAKCCGVCKSSLKKKCFQCSRMVSYSNVARHTKTCLEKGVGVGIVERKRKKEDEDEEEEEEEQEEEQKKEEEKEEKEQVEQTPLTVGFLCSEWNVDLGIMPSGQYFGALHEDFPKHFQKLEIDDPTGQMIMVDAYDAIWGTLFAVKSKSFKLVHTFRCLDEVFTVRSWSSSINILVIGNWAHHVALKDNLNGKSLALDMYHRLQDLEIQEKVRIFPPLDYVWCFAQKVHYYNKLSYLRLPKDSHVIPTIAVSKEHAWKKKLLVFAEELDVKELMLKRELSEMSKHTIKMKVNSLQTLEGRSSGFNWMAQPVLNEFSVGPEFRMFVIEGTCKWGVATRFIHDGDGVSLEKVACAPGRRAWDFEGGSEAARVAEKIVKIVSSNMSTHAARFLRVDMVKRNRNGGWWINELEYFGNAFIHFESFDNASEMLGLLVECVDAWLHGTLQM